VEILNIYINTYHKHISNTNKIYIEDTSIVHNFGSS